MKIGYSKTFPVIGKDQWEKIWIEDEVQGTEEDARKALYALKKQVENFHYESNKAADKQATEAKEEPPQTTEAKIIAQIYGITDLKVLGTFALLAAKDREKKGEKGNISAAYQQQLEKLSKSS